MFAGSSYWIYTTWIATLFPQKTRGGKGGDRARKTPKKVDPNGQVSVIGKDGPAVTSSAQAYELPWIPQNNLEPPKVKRSKR